jgi:superfamily II DNA helicase RecQ
MLTATLPLSKEDKLF